MGDPCAGVRAAVHAAGRRPDLVLAAYRVGDSPMNVITPLNVYLAVMVGFAQKYQKDAGIGTIVALMLPYTIVLLVLWTLLLIGLVPPRPAARLARRALIVLRPRRRTGRLRRDRGGRGAGDPPGAHRTVAETTTGETVTLTGTVESQVEVDLAFRIGGRLLERTVNVGDTVEAGQRIAALDPMDEENALRAAEAALAASGGQLAEARANFDRQRQLYERQFVALAALERAEQVLTSAQGSFDAAEAQVGIARRRLADTALYADAPGVVTAIGAEPGEVVQAGRMIVEIARDEGKDAVFDVPAAVIAASPPDPEVTVTLSLTPAVTAMGRVREIAPRADPVTGTFRVRVGLIDPPEEMRLGSTVNGQVHFGGTGGIELPRERTHRQRRIAGGLGGRSRGDDGFAPADRRSPLQSRDGQRRRRALRGRDGGHRRGAGAAPRPGGPPAR
jgi:RND family efflux transporter MFP subunit